MSDLISRKALLKEIIDFCGCVPYLDGKNGRHIYIDEMITQEPTAYDVEKVVERLELENKRLKTLKNNCIALCDHEVIGIENKAYDYAIKIVRNGGKDE